MTNEEIQTLSLAQAADMLGVFVGDLTSQYSIPGNLDLLAALPLSDISRMSEHAPLIIQRIANLEAKANVTTHFAGEKPEYISTDADSKLATEPTFGAKALGFAVAATPGFLFVTPGYRAIGLIGAVGMGGIALSLASMFGSTSKVVRRVFIPMGIGVALGLLVLKRKRRS